jgi:class 3 adenylate cyclase
VPVESQHVPTGAVTFLFSDVVGSTRLWAADAEAMSASLRIHDQILNDTIAKFSGHVFATAGDSFAVAFQRASAAVECAAAIQVSLSEIDWDSWPAISVRIGLHLGEAEERDGNYFGPPVNQAARVMAVAHGGQCVLTDGVRDAAGITATDLGTHTLRDIETPVHLNQLGTEAFPPLGSVGTGIVSLPSPRTSLVGREASVAEVRELIGAHRLVTLTGVGGCGKTLCVPKMSSGLSTWTFVGVALMTKMRHGTPFSLHCFRPFASAGPSVTSWTTGPGGRSRLAPSRGCCPAATGGASGTSACRSSNSRWIESGSVGCSSRTLLCPA